MLGFKKKTEEKVKQTEAPVKEVKQPEPAEAEDIENLESEQEENEAEEDSEGLPELNSEDLIKQLLNHEQRIQAVESALFRLKAAI